MAQILPPGHPAAKGAHRTNRSVYRYPNGSEIDVVGLDDPSKVMSAEYDVVYVNEATEVEESDWELLTTRLRHNRIPGPPTSPNCVARRCPRLRIGDVCCEGRGSPRVDRLMALIDKAAVDGATVWMRDDPRGLLITKDPDFVPEGLGWRRIDLSERRLIARSRAWRPGMPRFWRDH